MARGKFIVFEGIDGSGKSTHAVLLKERLEKEGYSVFLTMEPSEGEAGKLLRRCLTGKSDLPEQAIAGLFMTDRIDHILNPASGLLSHLEKGEVVLCDRYYFSSFAYNGMYAPMDWVIEINRIARETLKPDLTLFLDIQPESFLSRTESRAQTERYEKVEVLKRVRENYRKAFAALPEEKVTVVDNNKPLAQASEEVYRLVKAALEEK
ncbi:MAG TPA: dTMP kinase [Clostridiales bacterium]|nr:dTMP kinase [Clostridiales bacterium]HCU55933.1 dTMP kinase [Clostridiales bacterium]